MGEGIKEGCMWGIVAYSLHLPFFISHESEITLVSLSKHPSPLTLSLSVTSPWETKMTLGAGSVHFLGCTWPNQ